MLFALPSYQFPYTVMKRCFLLTKFMRITLRATSHIRLRAHDHCTSSTLIRGKAELVQFCFTLCLLRDQQRSMWMQDGCGVYMDSYMASNESCFPGQLDYFQKPPLGDRPDTKSGDHGTPNAHNCWFNLLSCARTRMNRNSLKCHLVEGMVMHNFYYTWGSMTTLHEFERVVGRLLDTCLLGSHNFVVTALGSCVKWPLSEWGEPTINVRREPIFSVMAASWFCEKCGWIGKVEDVKPVLLKWNKNGFSPATILRRRIFTRTNCEIGGFHPV